MIPCLALWLGLTAAQASGTTVAVAASADNGPLPDSAVQSLVWHAMATEQGHHTILVDPDDTEAWLPTLKSQHISTLLEVRVHWSVQAILLDGHIVADDVPTVQFTEWVVRDRLLESGRVWEVHAPMAVVSTHEDEGRVVTLPEVALQEAVSQGVAEAAPPVWRGGPPSRVAIPVEVCADPQWRERHGPDWRKAALDRLDRADQIVHQAGLTLHVAGYCEWQPGTPSSSLTALLEDLHAQPLRDGRIRLGLTARPDTSSSASMEYVGRAYTPGRDLVVADQTPPPGHDPVWDVVDEGTAIAHELLHTLGLDHSAHTGFLMSPIKRHTVHVVAPSSRALARAAAEARYRHWDPVAAMKGLTDAAQVWIEDPDLQVDYIRENLAAGPGVPSPGSVDPERISALASLAIGRHWVDSVPPGQNTLRTNLLAHGHAAQTEHPVLAQPLIQALSISGPPAIRAPAASPSTPEEPAATTPLWCQGSDVWSCPTR